MAIASPLADGDALAYLEFLHHLNKIYLRREVAVTKSIILFIIIVLGIAPVYCQEMSGVSSSNQAQQPYIAHGCAHYVFDKDNIPHCIQQWTAPNYGGSKSSRAGYDNPQASLPVVDATAFANGANAAAGSNAPIRDAMANSALRSWSATPALSPPSDSIAAAASLTDPFATSATCSLGGGSSQTNAVDDGAVEFLQTVADSLKKVKSARNLAEPAALGLEALNAANGAAAGEIPTTISSIRKLADFLNGERNGLSALSKKSSSDWLAASGINSFDRSTIPAAQTCLDNFSQRLSTLQGVVQQLTPTVQMAQTVLENSEVNDARMAVAGNTLPTGDSMAIWNDIIPALGNISTQIDTIQSNLSQARLLAY